MKFLICFASIIVVSTAAGQFTSFNANGAVACGDQMDAKTQRFVAIGKKYWTTSDTNDPVCKKCVQISYNGKTINAPVKDMCGKCGDNDLDLSEPVFKDLGDLSQGKLTGGSWSLVNC